jgi:RNase P/RNase MRP subunit POP5
MRRSRPVLLLLALVAMSSLVPVNALSNSAGPSQKIDITSLVRRSQFIFLGTVEKAGATAEVNITAEASRAIVRVDRVLRAPELFQAVQGRRVTVQLHRDLPVKNGDAAVFFTRSWFYGESLGVVEVGRMDAQLVDSLTSQIREAEERIADEKLSERIVRAQLIVLGTVTAVAPASPEARHSPFTEHDPDWWRAKIAVEKILKGRRPRNLSVLFAGSTDEMWIDSPKLEEGQTAIFLLQRDQKEKGMPALRRPGWTALDPLDVQPPSQLERVRRLSENPLLPPGGEEIP